ncbi:Replication factor A protein 2 [Fusarium oxysporum f. sp. albedinis]|nr:Replication factor A protein 2 [Fusarium oxysporum f. sp. albedinis]
MANPQINSYKSSEMAALSRRPCCSLIHVGRHGVDAMRAPPPMGKTFQAWYRKIQEYHAHHTPFRLLAFPSTAIRLGFLISVPQRYSPIVTQDCKPSDLKFSLLVWGREDGIMPRYLVSGSCIGGVMVTHNRTCSTIGLLCTLRTTGKHADSMKSVPFYSCLLIHLPRCQPNLITYIPNDKLKTKVCHNSLLTMTVATLQQLKCWRPTVKCSRRVPYNV